MNRALRLAAAAATCALLAGCTTHRATPQPAPAEPCLGSVDLCDRPFDTVALMGTHQGMATGTDPGWVAPWTNLSVPQQLDRGVRALGLELRYGTPHSAGVQTDAQVAPPPVPPAALRDELATRSTAIGFSPVTGQRGVYACAGSCELGAVPLVDLLREVNAWLVEHPRELVVLVMDDYVAPDDVAAAFRESTLQQRVITGPLFADAAAGWPTVGEMLGRGQALVLRRSGTPGAPEWFRDGLIADTNPLPRVGPGTCSVTQTGPRRLLVMEHWRGGEPPELSAAIDDNRQAFLAARVSQCRQAAGRLPGLIMVAFPEVGDVARVQESVDAGG